MSDKWIEFKEKILARIEWQNVYNTIKNQKTTSGGWVTGLCPFHNDNENSFAFNTDTLQWCCFAGCGKGSVFDFIMNTSGMNFKDTLLEWGAKLNISSPFDKKQKPEIKKELIRQWTEYLKINKTAKIYINEKRGVSDKTIEKYQIGWHPEKQRNTIPIKDKNGKIVNVRLYNAKKNPKIISYTDGHWKYGSPARLYGIDELVGYQGKQVIICEGEWDRLLLRQEGFMAVTSTHGCNTFRPEWIDCFKNKDVVVIYDCDQPGKMSVQKLILPAFKGSAVNSIKIVLLPLDGTKDDKDITDFFHKRGYTAKDLQKIIDETPVYIYKEIKHEEKTYRLNSFLDIKKKEYADKKVQCEITFSGESQKAFHAAKQFNVKYCPKMKKGECFRCKDPIIVPNGAKEYIGSCMSTDIQITSMLRNFCCDCGQKPVIDITKKVTVKEFFAHQKVHRLKDVQDHGEFKTVDENDQGLFEIPVYYISSDEVAPGDYIAVGYVKTHPKTQQICFLIEELIPQQDDFRAFILDKNIGILEKLRKMDINAIIEDLTENVTKIYGRDEILTALLLTYCSPLHIFFNGSQIRGWLITIVVGDAGTGKSQTAIKLSEYIDIGDIFSGLTGSRTGLAYALIEHPHQGWQVKIGRYPANSGKILLVDEGQFISETDMRTLSKAMEDGVMSIDRVKSKKYASKTRLFMICNPRDDKIMDEFSQGCRALKELYHSTIIRRIDMAVFANTGDFESTDFFNKYCPKNKSPEVSPKMLRTLIYWAWNLKIDQIKFENKVTEYCLFLAGHLSNIYGFANDIPLILQSDVRNNLVRVATAFAVLDVSANEDYTELIVKKEHIQQAAEFLIRIYSHQNCKLNNYSTIQKTINQLHDYKIIAERFIKKQKDEKYTNTNNAFFTSVIHLIYSHDSIKRDTLAAQSGCSKELIDKIIRFLKQFNLIDSRRSGYIKTPKFNRFMGRFLMENTDFFHSSYTCCTDVSF